MPHQIIFREQYGANGREVVYIKPPDQRSIVPLHSSYTRSLTQSTCETLQKFFCVVFLPQGYPDSVSKDYYSYQLWDTVQAFCSSLNGTLTTQAIMKGVGVGNQAATPLAAAITWILKDGAGNIGRIIFAWWKGTSLDADCKKWRLCADFLNDLAMSLELLLPFFMSYSTAILCTSTVMKSIVGVAGGATRAALTQHQAIRDNMADVSAKDGSQETCVNLLAAVAGIVLLTSIGDFQHLWIIFAVLTYIHLYANYKAVKSLRISTLNRARLNIVISNYLDTGAVLSPDITNEKEAVFLGWGLSAQDLCGHNIRIGESVTTFVRSAALTTDQLKVLHHLYQDHGYMLFLCKKQKTIDILLQHGVSTNSSLIVKAYFHAVLLGIATNITENDKTKVTDSSSQNENSVLTRLEEALKSTYSSDSKSESYHAGSEHPSSINAIMASMQVDAVESERFLSNLHSAGWASGGHHLGSDEWRYIWPQSSKQS